MTRWIRWWPWMGLLIVLGIGFADHHQRTLVDWTSVRAVVLQSDDWGLRGFVPDRSALDGFDKEELGGTRFPEIYWSSTLEDSVDVAELAAVLIRHRGRDGLPTVFQPNMILSRQSVATTPAVASSPDAWKADALYQRRGLDQAVAAAMAAGVWHPELHGLHHYDPAGRARALEEQNGTVARAFQLGVLAFPGSHRDYELGPDRSTEDVRGSWSGLAQRFQESLGQPFVSVIAGDYVWEPRHEDLFRDLGVQAVQAKSHQRRRDVHGPQMWKRVRKAWSRSWDRLTVKDLVYLDRTALFEKAQSSNPDAHRRLCLQDVL